MDLLDSNNRPVSDGEPGEICVRGPLVMDGYRDNPELTAQTFSGGWLHTGDVAVRDPGGFLQIIDRPKDHYGRIQPSLDHSPVWSTTVNDEVMRI